MSDEKTQETTSTESTQENKKNKKIKSMTLQEIEKTIEKTKSSQQALSSKYAKQLLKQRDYLKSLKS